MSYVFQLNDKASIEAACSRLAAMNSPNLPLFRAAADGDIFLALVTAPDMVVPEQLLKETTRPIVVLIGDDPDIGDGIALGPDAWAEFMACPHTLVLLPKRGEHPVWPAGAVMQ